MATKTKAKKAPKAPKTNPHVDALIGALENDDALEQMATVATVLAAIERAQRSRTTSALPGDRRSSTPHLRIPLLRAGIAPSRNLGPNGVVTVGGGGMDVHGLPDPLGPSSSSHHRHR
jgi:hypothetical protein